METQPSHARPSWWADRAVPTVQRPTVLHPASPEQDPQTVTITSFSSRRETLAPEHLVEQFEQQNPHIHVELVASQDEVTAFPRIPVNLEGK